MSPSDFLPAGISPETVFALVSGTGTFVSVLAIARAYEPHDPMGTRIKAHAKRRAELRAGLIATPRRERRRSVGMLRGLVDRLHLTKGEESRTTAEKLTQAGMRSRDALVVFLGLRLIMPLIL